MRRFAATTVLALLAACSRDAPESKRSATTDATDATDAAPTDAASAATEAGAAVAPDGGFALTPPSSADWQEVTVSKAKVKLRIPSGATVPDQRAGFEDKFAGSFLRVVLPSGYDVFIAERHGTTANDVATEKLAFRSKTKGKGVTLYEADDALVTSRDEGPPTGKYCETTACGKIAGRPICATAAGARIDGTIVKKLTETECLAVVSIVRSLQAL